MQVLKNVPGIVGYGKAAEIAMANMDERIAKETQLRDYLIKRVTEEVPFTRVNGSNQSSAKQRKLCIPVYRRRVFTDQVRHSRYLRFQRFCMYLRILRPISCTVSHRSAS